MNKDKDWIDNAAKREDEADICIGQPHVATGQNNTAVLIYVINDKDMPIKTAERIHAALVSLGYRDFTVQAYRINEVVTYMTDPNGGGMKVMLQPYDTAEAIRNL